jgi:hypothetical protein
MDPKLVAHALKYLQDLTGEKIAGMDFYEALKSGVVLCKALNKLRPGLIEKINEPKMPLMERVLIHVFQFHIMKTYCFNISWKRNMQRESIPLYESLCILISSGQYQGTFSLQISGTVLVILTFFEMYLATCPRIGTAHILSVACPFNLLAR